VRGVGVTTIVAGARDRTHRLLGVALDIADPGHAVARLFADDAADFGQQARFVDRPHQRLMTGSDGAQLAIEALERRLRALASGHLAAGVEHTLAFPSSPTGRVHPAIDGAGHGCASSLVGRFRAATGMSVRRHAIALRPRRASGSTRHG